MVKPAGDITGGWVTPVDTPSNPPASPGSNVAFESKHSVSASGGTPNNSQVINIEFSLTYGAIGAPYTDYSTVNIWNGVANTGVASYAITFDSNGEWKNAPGLTNKSITGTRFLSSPPGPVQVKYVADASTTCSAKQEEPKHNYKVFAVSFPTGNPNP